MQTAELDYEFDPGQIAQFPLAQRDQSRLMVLDRRARSIVDASFRDLRGFLSAGDLLVLNDAKVLPARLTGKRASGAEVELLLTEELEGGEGQWLCLSRGGSRVRLGEKLEFGGGLRGLWGARQDDGRRLVAFFSEGDLWQVILRVGRIPLPPYIRRETVGEDSLRYQTVYARTPGAIAAPTAGLHFTPELLQGLSLVGVNIAYLTLHVGVGTFTPIRTEELGSHRMAHECYCISSATAEAVGEARRRGGRVIAVGTTTTRALEAAALEDGVIEAGTGRTGIFIAPGYRFRVVDCMVTNFHLPRSTPLALVMALAGQELIRDSYRKAVAEGYRIYSYGDAMLIR